VRTLYGVMAHHRLLDGATEMSTAQRERERERESKSTVENSVWCDGGPQAT
jgi:hypothetical protein